MENKQPDKVYQYRIAALWRAGLLEKQKEL